MLIKNKFSKYLIYAIGEIILVVIGILIALSINNWNENQKNSIKETQFLESFKIDLMANRVELERVIKKSELTRYIANSILKYKRGHMSGFSLAQLDTLIMDAEGFTVYKTNEGVVQDILSSGVLDIIKNDSIRLSIGSWQANLKDIREWEKMDKESSNQYIDYLRQHIDIYKSTNKEGILTHDQKTTLFEDRLFLNYASSRMRISNILNKRYKRQLPKIDRLLSLVDSELKE